MSSEKRRKARRGPKANKGALLCLALVFLSSAGVRIASGSGAAIAKEISDFSANDSEQMSQSDDMVCSTDEETAILLSALNTREKKVAQQELFLAEKMKAIELARTEIEENLIALEEAENRLAMTMSRSQTASEEDLAKLTSVYETMKPKEAAALFTAMSPDFAAGFLGRMRSDAAAAIMAGLEPETAYTISVILAGRNAEAPSK